MKLWKKGAVSLAAASMILAPVAASAAPALDGARAASVAGSQNELEGGSNWIAIVLALAIIAGGVWLVVDDDGDDDPVSP